MTCKGLLKSFSGANLGQKCMGGRVFGKTSFWFKFKNELKPGENSGLSSKMNLNQEKIGFKFIFELRPDFSLGLSSFLNLNQNFLLV